MYVTIFDFWKAHNLCKSPSSFKGRLAWWQIVVRQCVWSSGQNSTLLGRGKVVAIILSANLQTVSLLFAIYSEIIKFDFRLRRREPGASPGRLWPFSAALSGVLQYILIGDPAWLNGVSRCWLAYYYFGHFGGLPCRGKIGDYSHTYSHSFFISPFFDLGNVLFSHQVATVYIVQSCVRYLAIVGKELSILQTLTAGRHTSCNFDKVATCTTDRHRHQSVFLGICPGSATLVMNWSMEFELFPKWIFAPHE